MMGTYAYTGAGYELDEDAARDYIRHGYLLSPRTVLKGRTKFPRLALPAISIDPGKLPLRAQQTIESEMGAIAGHRRAVMFSGGFDSMLIACLAQRRGALVTAVTVQFDEFNPLTVAGAVQFAKKLGIDHHILSVKAVEFLSAFEALTGITEEPVMDLELAIVYAALKKYDHDVAGNVFISGMGSDQWLGNESMEKRPGGLAARLDWAMVDQDAHQSAAAAHGCSFVFPFLSGPMLALSRSVPDDMKKDKKLLRAMAAANTIPHRGTRSEIQVPALMRHVLIKRYGDRAWPGPVSVPSRGSGEDDPVIRQIILGLWLEKARNKICH